jgi:homoserine kinase type II
MAVYTMVSADEIAAFIADYDVGDVVSFKGIAEGVENSNYLLSTTTSHFILTLYEKRVNADDLPFFLGLMDHLAHKGINCATPLKDKKGNVLKELCGRPAALISFLDGLSVNRPNVQNCRQLGGALAQMHLAISDFKGMRKNSLSVEGWIKLAASCEQRADQCLAGLGQTIEQEMDYLKENWPQDLPTGIIHADLFPNNVFFLKGKLSGLIDYYFACTDILAYDVAICLNAWCFEEDHEIRSLSADEMAALPLLCRGAALRFLLTRLYDWLNRVEGALVETLDPLEYLAMLNFHQKIKTSNQYGVDLSS